MNPAKRALASSVNFVVNHKVPIAIVATAVTTAVVVRTAIGNRMENAEKFIEDEGLMEKFTEIYYSIH